MHTNTMIFSYCIILSKMVPDMLWSISEKQYPLVEDDVILKALADYILSHDPTIIIHLWSKVLLSFTIWLQESYKIIIIFFRLVFRYTNPPFVFVSASNKCPQWNLKFRFFRWVFRIDLSVFSSILLERSNTVADIYWLKWSGDTFMSQELSFQMQISLSAVCWTEKWVTNCGTL